MSAAESEYIIYLEPSKESSLYDFLNVQADKAVQIVGADKSHCYSAHCSLTSFFKCNKYLVVSIVEQLCLLLQNNSRSLQCFHYESTKPNEVSKVETPVCSVDESCFLYEEWCRRLCISGKKLHSGKQIHFEDAEHRLKFLQERCTYRPTKSTSSLYTVATDRDYSLESSMSSGLVPSEADVLSPTFHLLQQQQQYDEQFNYRENLLCLQEEKFMFSGTQLDNLMKQKEIRYIENEKNCDINNDVPVYEVKNKFAELPYYEQTEEVKESILHHCSDYNNTPLGPLFIDVYKGPVICTDDGYVIIALECSWLKAIIEVLSNDIFEVYGLKIRTKKDLHITLASERSQDAQENIYRLYEPATTSHLKSSNWDVVIYELVSRSSCYDTDGQHKFREIKRFERIAQTHEIA